MRAYLSNEKICQELGPESFQKCLSLSQICFITTSTDICYTFYGLVIHYVNTIHRDICLSQQQYEARVAISPSFGAKNTGSNRSSLTAPRFMPWAKTWAPVSLHHILCPCHYSPNCGIPGQRKSLLETFPHYHNSSTHLADSLLFVQPHVGTF